MLFTITFALLCLGLFILYLYSRPSSPNKSWWLKTNIPVLQFKIDNSVPFHERDYQIYQEIKRLGYEYCVEETFGTATLHLMNLEDIKSVLIRDFSNWANRRTLDISKSDPYLSYVLSEIKDQKWKDLRNTITPAFSTGKIRKMYRVFKNCTNKFIGYLSEETKNSEEINISNFLSKFALDVIGTTAFGLDIKVYSDTENNQFLKMVGKMKDANSGSTKQKFMFFRLFPKLYQFLKISLINKEAADFFCNIIQKNVEQREIVRERREDLLQLMIDAKNHELLHDDHEDDENPRENVHRVQFTDEIITAQSVSFLASGVNTVVIPLMFAAYELALCPEIQDKLYQEILEAAKRHGEDFDYDTIMKLDYLDKIISETLRRYPPGSRTEREASQKYKFPYSKLTVEKGTVATISIYGIHHDPDYYPDPFKFNPERFSTENKGNRNSPIYMPFGIGPRNCIANRFALAEIKTLLAHLILKFKLEPCEKTLIPMKFTNQGKFSPDGGIWLKTTLRNSG